MTLSPASSLRFLADALGASAVCCWRLPRSALRRRLDPAGCARYPLYLKGIGARRGVGRAMPSSLQDAINDLLGLHSLGRYADMEQRARVALKSFAGTAILRELLGVALAAQRRFADALPHFERAARDHPGDAQFWDNLALCQCELKRYAPAEQSLRRSLALQPASMEALVALGRVLHLLKRHDEAREVLERALALAPGHPAAHYHLGEALAGLDQLE